MTVARAALALLAGFVVLVLLFPASGIDRFPPVCYSVFGYTVPCEQSVAVTAGAATALIAALVLTVRGRRTT